MSFSNRDVRKRSHSYNNGENWVSRIPFLRKREQGAYRIPGSVEKMAIRAAHPYYVKYM